MFGEKAVKLVVGPIWASLSSYLNLPAYAKVKWKEVRQGKKSYNSEGDYWRDAIGLDFAEPSETRLHDGDLVELQEFELSEWFPRAPGSFWTKYGTELRLRARGRVETMVQSSFSCREIRKA